VKVYIDTNIVINILQPHYESSNAVFTLAVNGRIDGVISVAAVTDIFYILRKEYEDAKAAAGVIFDILEIIKPADVLANDIYYAASLDFLDFEDAVISAVALREKAEYIITRNKEDFLNSAVPALTPDEFLRLRKIVLGIREG
jgi:predicted nucleic acid-binding protein